jgi:transaldolase
MDRLVRLHTEYGQSPWLDNLRRGFITSGELAQWRDDGIRGLTSNPTIFQKAIQGSPDYDEQFTELVKGDGSVEDQYWALVTQDIRGALAVFEPVHTSSNGADGYVSVEVAPELARDTPGTVTAARHLHETINRPNLMVKIPATAEGVSAINTMISEGRSINVTLIFSLERYQAVMEAYVSGLETFAADPNADLSRVSSVASFFISRVDVEVDRRLEAIGTPEALALRGRAAVAQGQLAYELFTKVFAGPRWQVLADRGARLQRPLWASTSTKNPAYPDTLYVDNLIGPNTVNTLPDATIKAFADHGHLARTVDADLAEAHRVWEALPAVGIDLADVARQLEEEGVSSFTKSFDELLAALREKAAGLKAQ